MPSKARYTRRRGGTNRRANRSSISRLSPSSESNEAAEAEKKGKAVAVKADLAAILADREAAFAKRAASKAAAFDDDDNFSHVYVRSHLFQDWGTYNGQVIKGRDGTVKHGLGRFITSRAMYQGEWKDDKEDGVGVYELFPTRRDVGYKYEGQFEDGVMTGYGVTVFSNGDTYRGYHLNGEFDGFGVYLHSTTGGVHKCEFKDGVKDGFGTYDSAVMSHSGLYSKDKFVRGRGTKVLATGSYTGDLKNDKEYGQGRFVYANGDVYEGRFKHNKQYGEGKLTMQNGTVQEGIWSGNRMTGEVTQVGHPTLYGDFVNGVPLTPVQENTYSSDDTDPDN